MAKLTDAHRQFIVERLALFDSPTKVVRALEEEFGLHGVARQQVAVFDPIKYPDGVKVRRAKRWEPIFHATRQRFLDNVADIPIAHRAVRLRRLQRIADDAERSQNLMLERDTIIEAAKEVGDYYTNRRELTGKGGGPIETESRVRHAWKVGDQVLEW